uniref:Uncharacterized protein n=1 Tax=Bicosoecida sp. CB-2014 TaxID=1486930 RepID=A0A7S1GAY4_9STRA|mmetsp:Transcript_2606/g.9016  ORF Transcript_2606/g.9016 Transcript_2606/m.9016 type:complete len:229 (+) Transcript_2606:113-799(+)
MVSLHRVAAAATLVAVAAIVAVAWAPGAQALKSKFQKEIDYKKLEEEWDEDEPEETDDWHEDSFEWKEKKKKNFQFDPENPTESLKNYQPSGMQMVFCKLKKAYWKSKKDSEELSGRWSAMMKTNALDAKAYAIDEKTILFTEDNGRIFEVKDFVMQQPEVYKFTWNSQDFYPEGVEPKSEDEAPPPQRPRPKKKGDKKDSKKKKAKAARKAKKAKKEAGAGKDDAEL